MLQSMTGYAHQEIKLESAHYEMDIKSLNSKHCDIYLKLPESLSTLEIKLRDLIKKRIQRGKINLSIKEIKSNKLKQYSIDKSAVQAYIKELSHIQPNTPEQSLLEIAMNMPDSIVEAEQDRLKENENQFTEQIEHLLDDLVNYRKKEGQSLQVDINQSLTQIEDSCEKIDNLKSHRVEKIKKKLYEKLQDINVNIDENRYEQEVLLYAEKLDINEEIVRLNTHIREFRDSMDKSSGVGKKLGFISQEIGREINTIGSKANDSDIQHEVISMKEALEQIKEQLLNVY
ncbi:MAG: YicC/YloC family endoribonuclease [Psychroflexus sp.]|jgi:uncharacterized protein (TIGR00255 family)|nr:YicC/YloC family endoribonuclease [Psychroflexus sp.]MDR9449034.1 YicC/YloC family endoribonuclease [Psychroflexus sp.]